MRVPAHLTDSVTGVSVQRWSCVTLCKWEGWPRQDPDKEEEGLAFNIITQIHKTCR